MPKAPSVTMNGDNMSGGLSRRSAHQAPPAADTARTSASQARQEPNPNFQARSNPNPTAATDATRPMRPITMPPMPNPQSPANSTPVRAAMLAAAFGPMPAGGEPWLVSALSTNATTTDTKAMSDP